MDDHPSMLAHIEMALLDFLEGGPWCGILSFYFCIIQRRYDL